MDQEILYSPIGNAQLQIIGASHQLFKTRRILFSRNIEKSPMHTLSACSVRLWSRSTLYAARSYATKTIYMIKRRFIWSLMQRTIRHWAHFIREWWHSPYISRYAIDLPRCSIRIQDKDLEETRGTLWMNHLRRWIEIIISTWKIPS